jgi:hypothetical protein
VATNTLQLDSVHRGLHYYPSTSSMVPVLSPHSPCAFIHKIAFYSANILLLGSIHRRFHYYPDTSSVVVSIIFTQSLYIHPKRQPFACSLVCLLPEHWQKGSACNVILWSARNSIIPSSDRCVCRVITTGHTPTLAYWLCEFLWHSHIWSCLFWWRVEILQGGNRVRKQYSVMLKSHDMCFVITCE